MSLLLADRGVPLSRWLAGRPLVRLDAQAERGWRLHRHGLAERADGLQDLARRHVGLHAARQLTPWMTMHSRLPGTPASELRDALARRDLLRVRCMRRTLHLMPVDLAAVAHTATLRQRTAPCELASARLGLTGARRRRLEAEVGAALQDGPLAYAALQARLGSVASGASDQGILRARQTVKNMWEAGDLVLGDASSSLHHEHRTFALTEVEIGPEALTADPAGAVRQLLEHYLLGYGPAAPRDFAWWSGIALGEARAAWESLADRLVRVRVDGIEEDLVALGSTVGELLDGDWSTRPLPRASTLAYEDPTLKGYFATRGRYVAEQHRGTLFNQIGEARASVMLDGTVAAVWHWDRARQSAEVQPLGVLDASARLAVGSAVRGAVEFLRSERRALASPTPRSPAAA